MNLRHLSCACALIVLAAAPVAAQTGGLEIWVVAAADRSPLPGARVVLTNEQRLVAETAALTNEAGLVKFPVLRAGQGYVVEVALPGFSTQRAPGLRVRSNETAQVVFQLLPQQQEVVRVSARGDVIDLDRTSATTRFSDEFIEQLPIPGRFYQNILTLAPGVNDADGDGNPNVHGARQRDFKAEVGGVSNVDPLTGQWLSFVHPASIEEVEVIAAGAGVEFGRAQGGFARIVQKQGSNEFEGALGFIYRSQELDGSGAADLPQGLTPQFTWRQPSIQVSGPVVKSKLWFRLAHERIKGEDPQNLIGVIEVLPRNQKIIADQLTWQVSPRNKLAFQFQASDLTLGNYGISSTVPVESSYTLRRSGPTYSLSWVAPYSAQLLMDSLVAWQDHRFEISPTTSDQRHDCLYFATFRTLNGTRCYSADSGRTTGSFPETSRDERQRLTVRSNLTWFKNHLLGTSHRFKFGFSIEDERFQRELQREPDINFYTQRVLLDPCPLGGSLPCFQRLGFTSALVHVPETSSATASGRSWAVYVEDQLEPASNLSLTIGLRVDNEEIDSEGMSPLDPSAEAGQFLSRYNPNINPVALAQKVFTGYPDVRQFQQAVARSLNVSTYLVPLSTPVQQGEFWAKKQRKENIKIRNTNLAPRLAIAWDPWRDGKSKLALSAGRYYDKIFLAVPLVELEPVSTTLFWRASSLYSDRYIATAVFEGVNPNVRRQMVDRDLRTPYQDELALSFERSIWPETSVKFTFIRRLFRDQLQDVDINHARGDRGRCVAAATISQPAVVSSMGQGAELTDPSTGQRYLDTDPGPGDGRIDDCSGVVDVSVVNDRVWPPATQSQPVPDGLDDLYVLNPGWGELLLVGNFNAADYTAFVIELIRRRYRNWEMQASYTWSRAEGNAEDFDQNLGNERNLREDERGFLDYDQRHVFRFNATRTLPAGFRIGGAVRWDSGLPFSLLESNLTLFSVAPEYQNLGDADVKYRLRYPTGQRNDQRNPSYWNLDLLLAKEFALGRGVYFQLTAEMFNLLNDDTIVLTDRVDGTNSGLRRFGRRYQLGARLTF